ncbi:MAG: electron transfer flavoprotein subunit alpha/FixB family protein, partial [Candidatus Lokiarchaeota archaeon]|nr:electron transfer flavoprotein subunit alpha/FixB family protein [Candidatus Lokiarchaeota archaeon]
TGLTADCTVLDMQPNTDLDQIRPAFGGNIMAHIRTPNNRPQFATVRYKIFDAPQPCEPKQGASVVECDIADEKLASRIIVHEILPKQKAKAIEDAEIIVVAGRGVKKQEDLAMIQGLADALGAQMATTRPLIEAGWADPMKQIGLSGRTVKPKLIITCGVSGSIQFRAGMSGSDLIVAINTDEKAPIFSIAHHAVIGDLYKVVPELTSRLKSDGHPSGACILP